MHSETGRTGAEVPRSKLPRAWRIIYLAHDRAPPSRQASSLDCPHHTLDDVCSARGNDHERPADLQRLRAFRRAGRSVLHQSVSRPRVAGMEPARRLARGWIELAFRADVAVHPGGSAVS